MSTRSVLEAKARYDELKALDALPCTVRQAIMYSPARHSPAAMLKAMREGVCECELLAAIEVVNQQMSADYRRKMATGAFSNEERP